MESSWLNITFLKNLQHKKSLTQKLWTYSKHIEKRANVYIRRKWKETELYHERFSILLLSIIFFLFFRTAFLKMTSSKQLHRFNISIGFLFCLAWMEKNARLGSSRERRAEKARAYFKIIVVIFILCMCWEGIKTSSMFRLFGWREKKLHTVQPIAVSICFGHITLSTWRNVFLIESLQAICFAFSKSTEIERLNAGRFISTFVILFFFSKGFFNAISWTHFYHSPLFLANI